MAKSLGVLTLDLVARIGGYEQGLDKAEREAKKRAAAIQNVFDTAFAGLAAGAAAAVAGMTAAFAGLQSAVNAVGAFQDLAEKTGASAEGLASFSIAAGTAGTDMEAIANASVKLTKNLTGVDDESKAAGAAIAALGLNIKDFKDLAPEDQISAVSKALAGFADGAGKTAVAVDLFGKSGADLLPFLKALEEQGGRQVVLTDKLIQQADDYGDRQAKATAELKLYAQALAVQTLPALTAFTGAMSDTIKEILGLDKATTDIANNKGVQDFAEGAVRGLAFLIDAVDGVVRAFEIVGKHIGALAAGSQQLFSLDFKGVAQTAKGFASDVDDILNRELFSTKLNKRLSDARNAIAQPQAARPTLRYQGAQTGGGGSKDDPTKKLLENELKDLQRTIDQERDLMQDRNKFLDLYNSQGLISIADYYKQRQAILDESTQKQIAAYDAQIKALQDFQAKAPKATDRAEAQGKINDLLEKQAKLQRDSGSAAIEASIKQVKAVQDYRDQLNEVNAKILELQGNLGAAADIRFEAQNRALRQLAESSGDFATVEQIDRLRQYSKAQAEITGLQQKFSLAQGDLQIAEERITIARERGTMGEIQALQASGAARREAVAIMQQQLEKFQAIDAAARTPEQAQAIERLKVQLEGLKATIDPLADRFNQILGDAAGNAFGDFITGTKSAKEAFKDFANTVISEIARMAAKDLAKSLFGGGGDATGGVGFNFGSLLSSLFGGARASGGPVEPNTLYRVNERGPELFEAANGAQFLMTGSQSGRVHPNGQMGGDSIVNVSVQGRIDRETANQIANQLSLQQRRARRLA